MNRLVLFLYFTLYFCFSYAQEYQVPLTGGSTKYVEAKVNGEPVSFIFDTGASYLCISEDVLMHLYQNGKLKPKDFGGSVLLTLADGSEVRCSQLKIQELEVGKCVLHDVEAVVIPGSNGSCLFGQSALNRFTTYKIVNNKLYFTVKKSGVEKLTYSDVFDLIKQGKDKEALQKVEILHNKGRLDGMGESLYATLLASEERHKEAATVYKTLFESIKVEDLGVKNIHTYLISAIKSEEFSYIVSSIKIGEKYENLAINDEDKSLLYQLLGTAYIFCSLNNKALRYFHKSIDTTPKPSYVTEKYLLSHKYEDYNLFQRYSLLSDLYESLEDAEKSNYYRKIAKNCSIH